MLFTRKIFWNSEILIQWNIKTNIFICIFITVSKLNEKMYYFFFPCIICYTKNQRMLDYGENKKQNISLEWANSKTHTRRNTWKLNESVHRILLNNAIYNPRLELSNISMPIIQRIIYIYIIEGAPSRFKALLITIGKSYRTIVKYRKIYVCITGSI